MVSEVLYAFFRPKRLSLCEQKLTFRELWCSTSCFETVLNLSFTRFSLVFRAFQALAQNVAPLFNHKMGTQNMLFYCRKAALTTPTSSSGLLYFTCA